MSIQKSFKVAVATMASAGLIAGFGVAGLASASPYHHGHHRASDTVVVDSGNTVAANNTGVELQNNVLQNAVTGSATVESESGGHHWGGWGHHNSQSAGEASATTGAASNTSTASATVTVQNQAVVPAVMPSIPEGAKVIHSGNTTVTNSTQVGITNSISQTAVSGDATVEGNVSAGSAVTGAASNTSSASFVVSVSN